MNTVRNPRRQLLVSAGLATLLGACGGGGGSGSPPAAPAVIDTTNAATITSEVLEVGFGAGSLGGVVGGGILSADGGSNALGLTDRALPDRAQPSLAIPAENFDCLLSGRLRLSGSVADADTLTPGDRINVTFTSCNDGDGATYAGGLRLDITAFSGDILGDQFLLGSRVTLTDLAITDGGGTVTGDGLFDLDLDLRVPGVSDLTLSGARLEVRSGSDAWTLRDFAVTVVEDATDVDLRSTYTATGTLEGAEFAGAVDFVTVVPLAATGDAYPSTGELLISGANGATIRATVLSAETVRLAIDTDGDTVTDDTQDIAWTTVGPLGAASRALPSPLAALR